MRATRDGSRTSINGTSDWVYEEELGIRQAFQWSPDSKRLLFWHFDASAVRDFPMINDTDSLYPYTTAIPYPKAGTTNSRVTLGVVAPSGGAVTWMDVVGDTAASYIGQVQWLDSATVLVQHLNRKQNRNDFWVGDAATGRGSVLWTDQDSAWVLVQEPRWVAGGKAGRLAIVESERDGWRHLYTVNRTTGATTLRSNSPRKTAPAARAPARATATAAERKGAIDITCAMGRTRPRTIPGAKRPTLPFRAAPARHTLAGYATRMSAGKRLFRGAVILHCHHAINS